MVSILDAKDMPDVGKIEYDNLNKTVTLRDVQCFSLYEIDASGQTFLMYPIHTEDTYYHKFMVIRGDLCLEVEQNVQTHDVTMHCTLDDFRKFWAPFFDLYTSYSGELDLIMCADDGQIARAAESCRGIRLLRQDPWDTMLQFLMSSANKIPRIRELVKAIADTYGHTPQNIRRELVGQYKCLPRPDELLAKAGNADKLEVGLRALGCGYRARYVADQFRQEYGTQQFINFIYHDTLHSEVAKAGEYHRWLVSLVGIGEKIASCIELYGLHDVMAYPVDTWMVKIHRKYFNGKKPVPPYLTCPMGLVQLYLYYWERAYAPD